MTDEIEDLRELGWPLNTRKQEFERRFNESPDRTFPVEFQGRAEHLKIIRVPIGLPKYRLENGRTASAQQEWLAKNPEKPRDFFSSDPERLDVQTVQHQLLSQLVKKAGLLEAFKNPAQKQVEPILLDENGFVLNGNRRLCCWRRLYKKDPSKFGHFSHVDVVVLPHCDDKELDRIEAQLQVKRDIRADYSWETEALMLKDRLERHNFSREELAQLYDLSQQEIDQRFEMLDAATAYLDSRNIEAQWSSISGDEFAFKTLVQKSRGLAPADKQLFRHLVFALIDNPEEVGSRVYEMIPKIRDHLDHLKIEFAGEFEITETSTESDDLTDLFGSEEEDDAATIELSKIVLDSEHGTTIREVIGDAVKAKEEIEKESKKNNFLLKSLSRANSALQTAIPTGMTAEAVTEGADEQIKGIKEKIAELEKWLAEKGA